MFKGDKSKSDVLRRLMRQLSFILENCGHSFTSKATEEQVLAWIKQLVPILDKYQSVYSEQDAIVRGVEKFRGPYWRLARKIPGKRIKFELVDDTALDGRAVNKVLRVTRGYADRLVFGKCIA